ncbi:MAG: multicopper oxidase family protein [Candidatus Peregrinibacteria bacterium]|nr:multicopper oxidase family protein [Candidatus Peregrinibacteria bacterium]MDZ4245436.1 multicopper oxidase family protein [Candidatus Gracilibacteria bacterium]
MKNKLLFFGIAAIAVAIIGGIFVSNNNTASGQTFSTGIKGLSSAEKTEVIELKDGDAFNLTAGFVKKKIGNTEVRMLAYNGSIPGPTLKIPQGVTVTVNFKNDTDVENTIHSHGVRMANAFDGVPDVTQKAILPGESFTYTLTFPDAGVYWYHPHMRDDYAIELGLYGNFVVTPESPTYWNTVDREVAVFLDDILIENGKIAPFYKDGSDRALMGRFGNVMLVNGETDYTLSVKKGEVIRFYFTNSANARPFNLAIKGTKLKLVGGDNGAYEREEWKDTVLITPSERAVIETRFDVSDEYEIQNKTPNGTMRLGKIIVSDEFIASTNANVFQKLRDNDEAIAIIDSFRPFFDKVTDKHIKLSLDMMGDNTGMMGNDTHMMPSGMGEDQMMGGVPEGGIEWDDSDNAGMNAISNTDMVTWKIIDQDSGNANMDIDWKFKVGDKVKIRITNDGNSMHPMQHPIHFHGQRFLVLNKNSVPQTNLVWKDTVNVPAGEYLDILVDISNPGVWVAHCHILEHIEAGMVFPFTVEE